MPHHIRTPSRPVTRPRRRAREVADAVQDLAEVGVTDLDAVARHLGMLRTSLDRALLRHRHYSARDAARDQERTS